MPGILFISRELPEETVAPARAGATVRLNPEARRLTKAELGRQLRNADGLICLLTDPIDDGLPMAAARRVAEGDAYTRAGQFTEWGLMLLLGGRRLRQDARNPGIGTNRPVGGAAGPRLYADPLS